MTAEGTIDYVGYYVAVSIKADPWKPFGHYGFSPVTFHSTTTPPRYGRAYWWSPGAPLTVFKTRAQASAARRIARRDMKHLGLFGCRVVKLALAGTPPAK